MQGDATQQMPARRRAPQGCGFQARQPFLVLLHIW